MKSAKFTYRGNFRAYGNHLRRLLLIDDRSKWSKLHRLKHEHKLSMTDYATITSFMVNIFLLGGFICHVEAQGTFIVSWLLHDLSLPAPDGIFPTFPI